MALQQNQHRPSDQSLKCFILFLILTAIISGSLFGQHLVIPNKPYSFLISSPGYITINEFTCGVGLKDISLPFSKSYIGFNTIHGYQINRNFVIAAGTGVSVYNDFLLIPLFADIRLNYSVHTLNPYFSGEGGLLFNPSGSEKIFINPGAGIRYAPNKNIAFNLGIGLLLQIDEAEDVFLSFRLGLAFKPSK